MDVERAAPKGHGILSLFDWGKSKKSKKRLFAGGGGASPTPGSTADGKEAVGSRPSTPSNSILEDVSSMRESSEHSSSSSVIDEDARAMKGPTVVARLMGLDSMPATSSSGSYPIPSTAQQTFTNNVHDEFIGRSYIGSPSPHKMPSSPIDRFGMEALPQRFAKRSLSGAQHKLFSPVKNPNHTSGRNAADIMEAASRIIGPGVESNSSYRARDVGYSNVVRAFNTSEIVRVQQMSQAAKKRDTSASAKAPRAKPFDGSLVTSETTSSSRFSESNGNAPVAPRVKAASRFSLDPRAASTQGSGGRSKNSRKPATHMDPEHNMAERNRGNQQKSNNQTVASSSNSLEQNNRKRNAMGVKHKVNPKSARLSQQGSNTHSTNASPRKAGITSTRAESSTKVNTKGEVQPTNYANRRLNSTAKTIPKPRRLPDGRMNPKKNQSIDKILAERIQRRVQNNIGTDEQSSSSTNKNKVSTEIVSFTFTSPVHKSLPGSRFRNHSVETRSIESMNSAPTSSSTSNTKPDDIDGDYLGILLEQKLRELTSRVKSPYSKPANGVRVYAPSPGSEDTSSIASTEYDRESSQPFKDGKNKFHQNDLESKSGQSSQSVKFDNDFVDQVELEHLHFSPRSTWEVSVSTETETCCSAESWTNANESRLFSCTEGAATSGSAQDGGSQEVDASSEYSDTASSVTATTAETTHPSESSSSCRVDRDPEIDFLRELLNASSLSGQSSSVFERSGSSAILDPRLLEELNTNRSSRLAAAAAPGGEEDGGKASRMSRRLLFDCANEALSGKCAYYLDAGYGSWFTGAAVLVKLSAEELHREMSGGGLRVAEESMVDELVYREMGGPRGGAWVEFKTESFEAGRDVAAALLEALVDEAVADLLMSSGSGGAVPSHCC
ncbi:unnamed protein product [Triticum turgidum subsp. durum]|uniref:DUF3741 domain-containing protein n=1 Tax=Triticum turgidum subsp. durum TaxID=4567 RepID=A0A9R0XMC6_TRITD|nr:unnamed protein product [Triticum turgidum subsp. durum]